jgi:MYXO-CTERM domain-containing protein
MVVKPSRENAEAGVATWSQTEDVMFPKRRFGLGLSLSTLLATLVQPLAAQAAVKQGGVYAVESANRSIVELSHANVGNVERFAFNLPSAPTGMCFGGPNNDLYVATNNNDSVYVVTEGGDFKHAQPFATGFDVAMGLDCTQDRVLLADYERGVFDITAGGDFRHAEPFAVSPFKHLDVFTDSKGTVWLSAGIGGLYDITAGGTLSFADRFLAYDLSGDWGIVGIGEMAGELYVSEASYDGWGRVRNLGGATAGSKLSDFVEYAGGIPYLATTLLGVGHDLLVVGHPDQSSATAVWNIGLGGDMRDQEPSFTGIESAGLFIEELAYIDYCGDGVTRANSAEQCDTVADSPNCDSDCTFAQCGDGHANAEAGETCDDGNTDDGDACPADCGIAAEPPATASTKPAEMTVAQPLAEEPATSATTESEPDAHGSSVFSNGPAAGCSVTGPSSTRGGWAAIALALGLVAARRRRP